MKSGEYLDLKSLAEQARDEKWTALQRMFMLGQLNEVAFYAPLTKEEFQEIEDIIDPNQELRADVEFVLAGGVPE